VFSTTLERVVGNSTLAQDDALEEVRRLKQQPGKDLAVGGAGLASALMELIDEFRPVVHPVILGGGTPYLPPLDEPIDLELVETRTFGLGAVYLRYQRRADD
jgi:dihydrofolate reductase